MGKNTRGAFNSPADGEGNDYVNDCIYMGNIVCRQNLPSGSMNYGWSTISNDGINGGNTADMFGRRKVLRVSLC